MKYADIKRTRRGTGGKKKFWGQKILKNTKIVAVATAEYIYGKGKEEEEEE